MIGSPTVSLVKPDSPLVEKTADDRATKAILIYDYKEGRENIRVFYDTLQNEFKDKTEKLAVISVRYDRKGDKYLPHLDRSKSEGDDKKKKEGRSRSP